MEQKTLLDSATRRILGSSNLNTPSNEPILAIKDDGSLKRLEEACFVYEPLRDGGNLVLNDGEPIYVRVLRYPDIYTALSTIGHLSGTSNYTWEKSNAVLLCWEGQVLDQLIKRHKRDSHAMGIIAAMWVIKQRQVQGDSFRGFKAEHAENMTGARRSLSVTNGSNVEKKGRFPF